MSVCWFHDQHDCALCEDAPEEEREREDRVREFGCLARTAWLGDGLAPGFVADGSAVGPETRRLTHRRPVTHPWINRRTA